MHFFTLDFFMKFFFIVVASYGLCRILISYRHVINIVDTPNERSMHTLPIPRSGGIAIFSAFLIGLWLCNVPYVWTFLPPVIFVFAVGLYDDKYQLKSLTKLLLSMVAAGWLFSLGFELRDFGKFFGYEVSFSYGVSLCIVSIAVAGFISSLNLIDGLDGLASIVSVTILVPFAYIGFKYNDSFLFFTSLILIASISGFLFLNWRPAKIFMGDSGSMLLGFLIAIVIVYTILKGYMTAISTLLFAAVPIFDTLIVLLRRVLHKNHPLKADKTHLHHILLHHQNGDTKKTVLLIGLTQALFSYLGLGFKVRDDIYIFILYLMCFVLFYHILTPKKIT